MHNITWYRLLALGMLAVPMAVQAQGPQPKITEIATIPGIRVETAVKMPNGHVIVYVASDSIRAYDLTTKQSRFITKGFALDLAISPVGDRIAYRRRTEDGKQFTIWSVAINPKSGAAAGPAQRVSAGTGDSPGFSPDGTHIAFFADVPSTKSENLVVIPATGGAERILAHFDFRNDNSMVQSPSWSPDGKWIYVTVGEDSVATIERVPTGGGKRETLFSHPNPDQFESSIEGRIGFFEGSSDKMEYATANTRGSFAIPPTSHSGMILSFPRTLLTSTTRPNLLHILDLATGKLTNVPTPDPSAHFVSTSGDGSHLAYVTDGEHRERVVLNVNGTGQRRFPIPDQEHLAGVSPWTPDGDGTEFFADSGRTVRKLSLATGASRAIATIPAPSRFFTMPLQQGDRNSLLAVTNVVTGPGARSHFTVVELHPDGTRSSVRDLSAEFQHIRLAVLTSSTQALVETGDSTTGISTEYVLVPLPRGPARRVPMPALEPGVQLSTVLPTAGQRERKWFVASMLKDNQLVGFQVMSTETDSTRVFRFPARTYLTGWAVAPLLPDNKQLITYGRTGADDSVTVYSLPLDGTARRIIARIPDPRIATQALSSSGLSANGRSLAFFSAGTPTSHIYDVDLTPILNLVKKP